MDWNEKIAQCVHYEGSIQQPIAPWANALARSYISFQNYKQYSLHKPLYILSFKTSLNLEMLDLQELFLTKQAASLQQQTLTGSYF